MKKNVIILQSKNYLNTTVNIIVSFFFHFFATKSKRESHKEVCENKDFCNVIMPSENNKILEFNQYQKSNKAKFINYADLECLIEKVDRCKNNPEDSSTTKVGEHIPSDF